MRRETCNRHQMIEFKARPLSVHASNEGWMRRAWNSVCFGVGKFNPQAGCYLGAEGAESDGMKPNPILELGRINGKLVVMGRNQTVKMLIQAPDPVPGRNLLGVQSKRV